MKRTEEERKQLVKFAEQLADLLEETKGLPRFQIRRIVLVAGPEFIDEVLAECDRQMANDGDLGKTSEGKARTLGGVFFSVAKWLGKKRLTGRDWRRAFYQSYRRPPKATLEPLAEGHSP